MTKFNAGLTTSLPASDPGSTTAWGSKRVNPRPQFCLCLTWSGCPFKQRQPVVSVPKEYYLRRHFETNHSNLAELDANEEPYSRKFTYQSLFRTKIFLSFRAMEVLLLPE